jgi:hypothetical protein
MLLRATLIGLVATTMSLSALQGQTGSSTRISLPDRVYEASRVYSTLQGYFNSQQEETGSEFDKSYQDYLLRILHNDDRRDFDLETRFKGNGWSPAAICRNCTLAMLL